jgi:hypothetical protein
MDGGEADVDCGGPTSCPRCADGKKCSGASDCQSNLCSLEWDSISHSKPERSCGEVSCFDGLQDGTEIGVDCGGNCAGCVGAACSTNDDCASSSCVGAQCAAPVIAAISAGSCALTTTSQLYCWGDGEADVFAARPIPAEGLGGANIAAVSVSASPDSGHNTCALTRTGAIICWGNDDRGQLGDGQGISYWPKPVAVVGLDEPATAISTCGRHSCALTASGAVSCWGDNENGQLGDGTTVMRASAVPVSSLGSGVRAIATGEESSCALTTQGGVKCWGILSGDGTVTPRPTPADVVGLASGVVAIAAGGWHTCALRPDGSVLCWGANASGELGDGTQMERLEPVSVQGLGAPVVAISAGHDHTCALTNTGAALCWGDNLYGELGDGTLTSRLTPVPVVGLDSGVAAISAGTNMTCALTSSGKVSCWGENGTGALGDGDTIARSTPTEVDGL